MHLFFDTETTGTPKNYNASAKDVANWPRIIQLAWAQYDIHGTLLKTGCDLIMPDGWVIPEGKFWVDNGFFNADSLLDGIPIKTALEKFVEVLNVTDILIAHNMAFDLPVTQAEMIRAGIRANKQPLRHCTMRTSVDICKIPGQYGFKWPKLEELHNHLFKTGFGGAHDALNDVMACAKCYFELRNLELM